MILPSHLVVTGDEKEKQPPCGDQIKSSRLKFESRAARVPLQISLVGAHTTTQARHPCLWTSVC